MSKPFDRDENGKKKPQLVLTMMSASCGILDADQAEEPVKTEDKLFCHRDLMGRKTP